MALLKLLGLCMAMFMGAFVCGEIPLRCTMNQRAMRYVTTVGVGLLIGVSFIVIIPEGVHTYYGAKPTAMNTLRTNGGHNATFSTDVAAAHDAHAGHAHDRRLLQRDLSFDGTDSATAKAAAAVAAVGIAPLNALRAPAVTATASTSPTPVHAHPQAKQAEAVDDDMVTVDTDDVAADAHSDVHPAHAHSHEQPHEHGGDEDDDASASAGHVHAHDEASESGSAHGHAHVHEECVDVNRSSANVGAALVLGFVVMFLVDRIGGAEGHEHGHGSGLTPTGGGAGGGRRGQHSHQHPHHHQPTTSHIHIHPTTVVPSAVQGNTEHERAGGNGDEEKKELLGRSSALRIQPPPASPLVHEDLSLAPFPAPQFDQTATIGILVHSAIDGLALGAISVSDNSSLELVVFFAIILHKAPAAFGLTSFLLHQGRERSEVRKHLLYFSLAAPLTSLLTYVSFSYYNRVAGASGSLSANTPDGQALLGLCLLFSAGTFLFTIAVHILPEIQPAANTAGGGGGGGGGGQGAGKQPPQQQAPKSMLLALIFGILAPLLFSSHNHGH